MLYLISEIIICFFAVIGMACLTVIFFDSYTASKTGLNASIKINSIKDPENPEYSIRILESLIVHSNLSNIIGKIELDKNVPFDSNTFKKLAEEYGNLRKEE